MIEKNLKKTRRFQKARSRSKKHLKTSDERKRVIIVKTNKYIYAHVYDDLQNKMLFSVSSISTDLKSKKLGKNIESAKTVGETLGKKLVEQKIKKIAFDRNGLKYHGKVKALADGCRSAGIEF